jgi:hypothetical protein
VRELLVYSEARDGIQLYIHGLNLFPHWKTMEKERKLM